MKDLTITDILTPSEQQDLEDTGYALGAIRIMGVYMHVIVVRVVAMRVTMDGTDDEETWLELADVVPTSAHSDIVAITALMGDGAGAPKLATHNGHTYLIGCAPYGS
ncbi:MAG: hypothetical protein DDT39_00015 [Firmicutes bacterium]|nr:hypothetical protein [candidate division NPL-UPA2 bacterium]